MHPTRLVCRRPCPWPPCRELTAQLITYNPDAAVFGYWRMDFLWQDSGVITSSLHLQGLPAVSYGEAIKNLQVRSTCARLASRWSPTAATD